MCWGKFSSLDGFWFLWLLNLIGNYVLIFFSFSYGVWVLRLNWIRLYIHHNNICLFSGLCSWCFSCKFGFCYFFMGCSFSLDLLCGATGMTGFFFLGGLLLFFYVFTFVGMFACKVLVSTSCFELGSYDFAYLFVDTLLLFIFIFVCGLVILHFFVDFVSLGAFWIP